MKLFKIAVLTLAILIAGTSILWAEETTIKPLDEAFDNVVIVPYDYHNKVFLYGQKMDLFDDYKMFQRNGHVLVPIRLMGYLAAERDMIKGYWNIMWDPQKPDDVVLTNDKLQKTVKLKVNSNTMYINNEAISLDVPPQKIEGRIVLPLRGVSEALNKKIEWLDGLIIISNYSIDLQNPKTLDIKDKIKAKLIDNRNELDYKKRVLPVTKAGDAIYYTRIKHNQNEQIEELYKKNSSGLEKKIDLPGTKKFGNSKLINNELYYVSIVNGKSELDVFNFADNKSRKLCALEQWTPNDGWLGDMKYINNEFYIVLHTGDCTMGSETLNKLENGRLKEITSAKSFINFDTKGEDFYYTDFKLIHFNDNLVRVNTKTGEEDTLGEKNFTYGISRTIEPDYSRYSRNSSLYIKDDYIYTLGYKENGKDKSSVYKISLNGKNQRKLTFPVSTFWLFDNNIYYIDFGTGYLVTVDLEGNNKKTLVSKKVIDVKFFNGNIYYIASSDNSADVKLGKFYKYNLAREQELKLSDKLVSEFFVGKAGVYYISEGYDLGLYKIDMGKSLCLVDDSIYSSMLTDTGIVYTLRYEEGIYTLK